MTPRVAAAARVAVKGELIALCKRDLAPYKYPRWFNFVTELPKTATGKIQRFKLRQASAVTSAARDVMPAG